MSTVVRTALILAISSCLFPHTGYAVQLSQPASVLPWESKKSLPIAKSPQKRIIVAPEAEATPQWLQKATDKLESKKGTKKKVARKSVGHRGLVRVEAGDFETLGQLRSSRTHHNSVSSKKRFRPQISTSTQAIKGPELRIPGGRSAKTSPSAKLIR